MSRAGELVERARELYRRGAVADALVACEQAAAVARDSGDTAVLADAATVIRTATAATSPDACTSSASMRCRGSARSDPVRTARVRAQLVATSDPFGPPEPLDLPPESDDPEAAFLRLQAWHAARFAIDHLPERLDDRATRRSTSAAGPAPTSTPRGDADGGWMPTPCLATAST